MPTRVTKRSPGKPAMICSAFMPTKTVPTRKAMAKAKAPMLMGSAVATANMTTRPRIAAIWGDMVQPCIACGGVGRPAVGLALRCMERPPPSCFRQCRRFACAGLAGKLRAELLGLPPCPYRLRAFRHVDAGLPHGLDLGGGGVFPARDHGARVAHAAAGRRGVV